MSQMNEAPSGPPYASHMAQNGGSPSTTVDIPITAVFLALYVLGAAGHMTVFQINRKRGHKFIMSGAMFGFCMSRILTTALRIGTVTHPTNVSLNIAAQIFLNAGVLIAYVIVLLLSQRLLRALQPRIGWSKILSIFFKIVYVLLGVSLALTIIFVVYSFYTLDAALRFDIMWIQRAAALYILTFNVVSLVVYLTAVLLPPSKDADDFGSGSMLAKKIITGFVLALCILVAGFRAGTNLMPARPENDPAWYQSKPAFYVLFFGVEIMIIYTLLISRFDQRFWIPNGSKKPGDYSKKEAGEKESDLESHMSK